MAASKAFEEIRLIWGFNDDLARLKQRFSYIQAFLGDLGKAKCEEKRDLVNRWLLDVKEVACSAENLMNDHAYEMLRRKLEFNNKNRRPSFKKKWRSYIRKPSRSPIVFRVRMTHRVKEIMFMFDALNDKAKEIGLQQVDLASKAVSSAATATATAADHTLSQIRQRPPTQVFIGRDKDMEKLMVMLSSPTANQHRDTNNNTSIPIIAIVGLGGLGKTTLARKLFEGEEDDGHFDGKKIWICVSENFITFEILKEMVESVTNKKCEAERNIDTVINILQENLKGKKLILVLDDVWNEHQELWDSLKSDLHRIGVATGSVILITTRNEKVATTAGVGASQLHKLEGLSDEDAWDLLKRQVIPIDPSYVEVVTSILKKCKGVPLAIKAIGGILNSKNQNEWHQIETSEVWSIQHQDDKNYIMPSLLLSYNHLNDVSIKQCFASCAIYPKDKEMEKGELVALWSAQGLLHHDQDKSNNSSIITMETIGESYIDVLINHSFLLLEKEDEDEVYKTRYKMHDLVHDLATHVLRKDLLVWKAGTKLDDVSHVRHLAVNNVEKNEGAPEITLPIKEIKKLRTVIFSSYGVSMWKSLNGARYLCTLIMADIGLEEVSPTIGELVHLRYLDLSHNDNLAALPESICNLYQLQTLRLSECSNLQELPRELHRLEKLQHIFTTNFMVASKGLQELSSLLTLPNLELCAEKGWQIDELGPLDQVKGGIHISGLDYVKNKEEAGKAGFRRKDKILHLTLLWMFTKKSNELNNDEDVLEGLEPHPNIQSLCVYGYNGVKFPEWIMKMSVKQLQTGHLTHLCSLTKLDLSYCRNCQQLPSLGQLPNLKVLKLESFDEVERIGDEFYKSNNNCRKYPSAEVGDIIFPSLKTLSIGFFKRLTTWLAPAPSPALGATAFPNLEALEVRYCPQLETTPYVHLTSLKHVVFKDVGGTLLDMVKGSNGLITLKLQEFQTMRKLPQELSNWSKLQNLEINDCENLEFIPSGCGLTSLRTLKVVSCPLLSSILLEGHSSLRKLSIRECQSLACIPIDLEDSMSLECLRIEKCPLIANPIPDIGKLQGLKVLSLEDAGELLSSSFQGIPRLHRLTELNLRGLTEEWDITLISSFTSLTSLCLINCPKFKSLPTQQALPVPDLSQLNGLKELAVVNAGEMMTVVATSIPQLESLRDLVIGGFKDEEEITKFASEIKSTPHSLRSVTLARWPKVKKLPQQLQRLLSSTTLEELSIYHFDELELLPDWIASLSSLKGLFLLDCKNLKYLPSKQAMLHLSKFHFKECPQLAERCQKHNNNDGPPDSDSESQWPNIEHIPFIMIEDQTILNNR